jgi:hypothetical protein
MSTAAIIREGRVRSRRCRAFTSAVVLTAGILSTAISTMAQENYEEWQNRCSIYFNTTSRGADVQGDVANFPVLLRLNKGNFEGIATMTAFPEDVRFADFDGKHLPYQIEEWKYGTDGDDTAVIWVKVENVLGDNDVQGIMMYWGKPSSVDSSNGSAVFDTAAGYISAWHLEDTLKDATANQINGMNFFSSDTVGLIGRCRHFDDARATQMVSFTANDALNPTEAQTVAGWFKTNQSTDGKSNISIIRHDLHFNALQLWINNGSTSLGCVVWPQGQDNYAAYNTGWSYSDDKWHFFTASYSSQTGLRLYMDGTQIGNSTTTGLLKPTTHTFFLGGAGDYQNNEYYGGFLDEVTVHKVARSEDWAKLCFQNQRIDQTLIEIGSMETAARSPSIRLSVNGGLGNFVNSLSHAVRFTVTLPMRQAVAVDVYAANGELVRCLQSSAMMNTGTHKFSWDGTAASGKTVPSGAYVLRVTSGAAVASKVILKAR